MKAMMIVLMIINITACKSIRKEQQEVIVMRKESSSFIYNNINKELVAWIKHFAKIDSDKL
ncbi:MULTISPECIES: hypothetical protein [Edwardsiella]|uniref:Lipoprotein n=1 Tax=Edwardsiella anguillarum TaxID=1821960 RepID=A0ABY8SIM8_9GAMM|nr:MULTISPECIES: hypothetical protein [Edwardsiella]GAJ66678.1 mechanosensitive ion channel family protein [Edwardsiella piscicida]AKR77039.2 hypothetical protein AAZ33_04195 [Edwardsiella sp. LADL05-105]KAB0587208.1 hypothetical protein F7P84_17785 [Edwardsiella anguillarum]MDA6076176.1 hypothetical protein [Edwardsiella anguillarum]UOU79930.1 hypothetical protein MUN71_04795 [Edwardsiella anguillarum]